MELEHTSVYLDAKRVMDSGKTSANSTWEVRIHYDKENDEEVIIPMHLQSINVLRNYVQDFADVTTISVLLGLGDYAHLIYPNRVWLEITIIQKQLLESSTEVDPDADEVSERFKAVLMDTQQAPTIAQGQESNSREALNRTQVFTAHFQLISKPVEQIRIQATGGIYRNVKVEDAIKSCITGALERIKTDEQRSVVGTEVSAVDNTDIVPQLLIPHGTRVVDVPGLIQERFGVYNSGLGSYVQGRHWFVYPLYDTSVFESRKNSLSVLVLPKRKYANIERTFLDEDGAVTVLATSETGFQDDSGTNTLNIGNGARFSSADDLMETPVTTGGNKARISRKDNNREFIAGQAAPMNNVAFKGRRVTSNPFPVYSELAAINGGMLRMVWENSDASLILPGMATKITYVDGDDVKQIFGVVHRVSHVNHNLGVIGEPRYKGHTLLDIFVNSQMTAIDE